MRPSQLLAFLATVLLFTAPLAAQKRQDAQPRVTINAPLATVTAAIAKIAGNTDAVIEDEGPHKTTLSRPVKTNLGMAMRYNATAKARELTHFQFYEDAGVVTLTAIVETVITGDMGEKRERLDSTKDRQHVQSVLDGIKAYCEAQNKQRD